MSESDKYWPAELSNHLLAGAVESGSDLYLIGNFGGFGGAFYAVFRSYEDAKKNIVKLQLSYGGAAIWKLKLPEPMKFITNSGEEIDI